MNEHLTPEAFECLVNGQCNESDIERLLMHLDQCEPCLTRMDQHWSRYLNQGANPSIPNLESSQVHAIEGRILRRIHAVDVCKQALRIALVGPLTLLKGLFGTSRRNR